MTVANVSLAVQSRTSLAVAATFKRLIEESHLYQSVRVDPQQIIAECTAELTPDSAGSVTHIVNQCLGLRWVVLDPASAVKTAGMAKQGLLVPVDGAKLFCDECESPTATNLTSVAQMTRTLIPMTASMNPTHEAFALNFQCQGCRTSHVTVLVARTENKLTLCGRAPIEQVVVPKVIPRRVRSFYTGATVARNSGQVLAANFLLRTLIEQFVRPFEPDSGEAEAALEAYATTLPQDFKDRFPSLKDAYGRLSVDIHTATGSEDLFAEMMEAVIEHFDARRLFRLADHQSIEH